MGKIHSMVEKSGGSSRGSGEREQLKYRQNQGVEALPDSPSWKLDSVYAHGRTSPDQISGKRKSSAVPFPEELSPRSMNVGSSSSDIISLNMDEREERIAGRYATLTKALSNDRSRAVTNLAADIPFAKPQNINSWMQKTVDYLRLLPPDQVVHPLAAVLSHVNSLPNRDDIFSHMKALLPIVDSVPQKQMGRSLTSFISHINECNERSATQLFDQSLLRVRRLEPKEKVAPVTQLALSAHAYPSKQRLQKMNELNNEVAELSVNFRKKPLSALISNIRDLPASVRSTALDQHLAMIKAIPKKDRPALLGDAGLVVWSLPKSEQAPRVHEIRAMALKLPRSQRAHTFDAVGAN